MCTVSGVVCFYPEGQGQCSPDGSVLKWWTNGPYAGCSEYPPALGTKCTMPGSVCEYITGSPGQLPTIYCCDGDTGTWDVRMDGCPNGNACGSIRAQDYDQTCKTNSDCVGVTEGDLCAPNVCSNCKNAAINVGAQAKYAADFESKDSTPFICPCPSGPSIVCQGGTCQLGSGP